VPGPGDRVNSDMVTILEGSYSSRHFEKGHLR
jgi:hypothetical protein